MKLLLKHCDILAGQGAGFRCLENAWLGIDGDTIDYIGTEKPQAPYDQEKDMTDRLLLPGLINCHNHSPMVLLRGVGSDLSLQEWLFGKIMPIEDKLTAEDIRELERLEVWREDPVTERPVDYCFLLTK